MSINEERKVSQDKHEIPAGGGDKSSPASRREFLARAGQAAVVPPAIGLVVAADSKPAAAQRRYNTKAAKEARQDAREAKRAAKDAAKDAKDAADTSDAK